MTDDKRHETPRPPLPVPAWMAEASDAARADLAALAARYPEKFTYQDGVLRPRRNK